jgi:muramidase (phage lysozyme)
MSLSLEGLRAFLQYKNITGFLHAIQEGEVTKAYRHTPDAYRCMFGGELADDLTRHPRVAFMSPWGWTSAAGAYQAMCAVPGKVTVDTWGDFCRDMGVSVEDMPFDPPTQDCFAVWCLKRRGALNDVVNGNFDMAVWKCRQEWASFPDAPYGQPTVMLSKLRDCYMQFGGTWSLSELLVKPDTQPPAPIEDHSPASLPPVIEQPQEQAMPEDTTPSPSFWDNALKLAGPIATAFNPIAGLVISAFTPLLQEKIGKELSKHGDPSTAKAVASNLTDVITKVAIRETKIADPVEAMIAARGDPMIVAKAEAAVTNRLAELSPFIDKMAALEEKERADTLVAQDAASARAKSEPTDMALPLLYGSLGGVGFITLFVSAVILIQVIQGKPVGTELWAALTGLIGWITAKAGTIYDYRFGTSRGSAAKDVLIGELSRRN